MLITERHLVSGLDYALIAEYALSVDGEFAAAERHRTGQFWASSPRYVIDRLWVLSAVSLTCVAHYGKHSDNQPACRRGLRTSSQPGAGAVGSTTPASAGR